MEQLKLIASNAVNALKSNGADKAQCDVGYSVTQEFNVDGGQFSLFRTLFDKHVVLTAIKDGKKGTVRQNRYDDETVASLASECLSVAESSVPDPAWDIAPLEENKDFVYGAVKSDTEKLFERCKELMADVKERYPKILMEQMIVKHKEVGTVYANSNGVLHSEHCGYYSVSLMYSGHDGDKASSFFGGGFTIADLDTPFIECATVAKDLSDVEKQIETSPIEGKFEGVIVLPPSSLSEFVYYTLSNFTSDGAMMQGTSPWTDSLGKQVADSALTISSNPLDERIVVGERVTSEGFLAADYDIIKDGVLNSFMLSQYVANKTGKKRAPNSDLSLVIKPGEKKIDNIISSIKKGVIVGRFSGGEPSPSGDFSGVAKNSFLIENGMITKALSETMISGNLADMMKNVYAISDDQICDGSSVLPYAAFSGITISGK